MRGVQNFYDELAESYHLIFEDWDRSMARQSAALHDVLQKRWGMAGGRGGRVIDAAVGIGTQALGLAALAYHVVGSDISLRAIARARREAARRRVSLPVVAADFRSLPFQDGSADAVIACDNAVPHLLTLQEIRTALKEMQRCVRPGGGIVLSMRDYPSPPPPGTIEHRPYGERVWNSRRFVAEQEWHWEGPTYRLVMRITPVDDESNRVEAETTYLAVPIRTLLELMSEVGFLDVQRVDDAYYQPLLLGTVPRAA